MSRIFTARNAGLAAGVVVAAYAGNKIIETTGFKTPGVKNIEEAYTGGGGTPTHLPATGTKAGDRTHTTPKHEDPRGLGSDKFKEQYADQKVTAPITPAGKAFNKQNLGNEKGK